jgi:biofilm PGA synthesis lipoprotein PgaB
MPGTWFCSFCLLLSLASSPPRSHEIQLRRNDYPVPPNPQLLRAQGFAKVIVRVFSDDEKDGGLYFANSSFKVVRPLLDDWAPRFGRGEVGLWAWMGGRFFKWFKDSRYLDLEWQDGQRRIIPKLDLFNPEAERIIVSLFSELAQKPVQGILIQDDLVLRRSEGFSNWGKAYYTRATGIPADERLMAQVNSAQSRTWARLKCERVERLLEKIIAACKSLNPQLKIGMNVHYETPLTPELARSWYAHDLAALAASSLDYFYLMAYQRQIRSELGLSEAENRDYFARMTTAALQCFGSRLVVKLQVRDWQTSELIPMAELKSYYDLIPPGVERVCFAAADVADIPYISSLFSEKNN